MEVETEAEPEVVSEVESEAVSEAESEVLTASSFMWGIKTRTHSQKVTG